MVVITDFYYVFALTDFCLTSSIAHVSCRLYSAGLSVKMGEDTRGIVRLGMPCELIAHRPTAKAAKIVNVLTTTCHMADQNISHHYN